MTLDKTVIRKPLIFFPDLRALNAYQTDLYREVSNDWDVRPGLPWDCAGAEAPGLFHLHWEHFIYRQAKDEVEAEKLASDFMTKLARSIEEGWALIWTMHNEVPHENRFPTLHTKLKSFILDKASRIFVHSKNHSALLPSKKNVQNKIRTVQHGTYEKFDYQNFYHPFRDKLKIEEDGTLFLFFGELRAYKGLDFLLRAFSDSAIQSRPIYLLIAGAGNLERYLASYTADRSKLRIMNGRIQEKDIPTIFNCANYSVFPYLKILNSGSLIMSMAMGIPALIPNHKNLRDFFSPPMGVKTYQANSENNLTRTMLAMSDLTIQEQVILRREAKVVSARRSWPLVATPFLEELASLEAAA